MERILREMRPVVVLEMEPNLLAGFGASPDSLVSFLGAHDYRVAPLGGHSNYVCHPGAA
jgi:hypothetical protein